MFTWGLRWLDPANTWIHSTHFTTEPEVLIDYRVPNTPSLIGAMSWLQGAVLHQLRPWGIRLTNHIPVHLSL